ncbi:hypothetical protein RSOLAG22IIIB_03182 [Rhizoctonia solani]|uniref:Nascent polypeptide-associated complex subunit alpha-like UBA domain-containing protein n=1 Tax=Rhizoctonia solani TaxID=456999 RepID=A0A0K6FNA5_9AGAM|nr:unnamed protein product [Rhizoctonia solani]CUA67755.1 hypothetical protein RSOLAG22IIIB_03182 [Rhizoctonia solani]
MAHRPEAEVIINFQDGFSYSKGRMDAALTSGVLEKPAEKKVTDYSGLNKADVKLVQTEMEVTEAQAKKALSEHDGDIVKTLLSLVSA